MGTLYFDFETFLMAPFQQAPPIACMSYAWDHDAPSLVHVRDVVFWRVLERALLGDHRMVAHNAA